jgi:hypothetical protein
MRIRVPFNTSELTIIMTYEETRRSKTTIVSSERVNQVGLAM